MKPAHHHPLAALDQRLRLGLRTLPVVLLTTLTALASSGCEAVYTRSMQDGKESCWKINDTVRRNECLQYYSKPYQRYEEDVKDLRKGK